MSGIVLKNVVKRFGDETVIPELSLSIAEGEFVVIVGPSGCGKSTTLRMIAGLEDVSSGSIHIAGRDVTWLQPKARDIAMVFQSYALYPHMNVAANMSFSLRLSRTPKAEIRERVRKAAEMLELTEFLERKPRDLSGGQRQRVAMGRSIVRDAYCFLFDEPLSNLDAKLRASMRTELSILHKKLDRTMIYVTHDQIEAMTMADRIVIMEKGRIQQIGTPREVYNTPDNVFVAGFIGSPSMNFLDAELVEEEMLTVRGDGFAFPLAPELAARAKASRSSRVVVGLRPEHFAATTTTGRAADSTLAPVHLEVDVAEYIGSSQFLAARIGSKQIAAAVEVGPDTLPMTSGEYGFDTNRLYLFDSDTGESI
ncbi:MAG: sn-glycerol-3-phosphate ABC transporter ATP-binding protein UgpC [Paracoccaceae bacterium]|nr:sn-glycerol-3-phosphate ABC transporter ATP-binding protein UgpC [Paracoccaceae bacterium]MDE2913628.1 sn-glycerol-3-phosphate ABC transporter ATP-binding protein UgpC [Paracoccaceae bacterium]